MGIWDNRLIVHFHLQTQAWVVLFASVLLMAVDEWLNGKFVRWWRQAGRWRGFNPRWSSRFIILRNDDIICPNLSSSAWQSFHRFSSFVVDAEKSNHSQSALQRRGPKHSPSIELLHRFHLPPAFSFIIFLHQAKSLLCSKKQQMKFQNWGWKRAH